MNFIGLRQNLCRIWHFCIIINVRTNGRVAIFPYLLSKNMTSNTLNFDAVLDLLDNENNNSGSGGISSDEKKT